MPDDVRVFDDQILVYVDPVVGDRYELRVTEDSGSVLVDAVSTIVRVIDCRCPVVDVSTQSS